MAQEISWEIREQAEELYVVDGKTFEEVAQITGVSITQLKRWGSGSTEADIPSWTERKKEYRTAFANIRRDTVLLRKRLIANALKSLDPQDVYAISRLESTVARVQKTTDQGLGIAGQGSGIRDQGLGARIIKTPQDAVDALQDVVEQKINNMLTKPGTINLAGIKEMKQALELIDKMKEKYKPETKGKGSARGLSDEVAQDIQKMILGISNE